MQCMCLCCEGAYYTYLIPVDSAASCDGSLSETSPGSSLSGVNRRKCAGPSARGVHSPRGEDCHCKSKLHAKKKRATA